LIVEHFFFERRPLFENLGPIFARDLIGTELEEP
jgi:hypothetical protein